MSQPVDDPRGRPSEGDPTTPRRKAHRGVYEEQWEGPLRDGIQRTDGATRASSYQVERAPPEGAPLHRTNHPRGGEQEYSRTKINGEHRRGEAQGGTQHLWGTDAARHEGIYEGGIRGDGKTPTQGGEEVTSPGGKQRGRHTVARDNPHKEVGGRQHINITRPGSRRKSPPTTEKQMGGLHTGGPGV